MGKPYVKKGKKLCLQLFIRISGRHLRLIFNDVSCPIGHFFALLVWERRLQSCLAIPLTLLINIMAYYPHYMAPWSQRISCGFWGLANQFPRMCEHYLCEHMMFVPRLEQQHAFIWNFVMITGRTTTNLIISYWDRYKRTANAYEVCLFMTINQMIPYAASFALKGMSAIQCLAPHWNKRKRLESAEQGPLTTKTPARTC